MLNNIHSLRRSEFLQRQGFVLPEYRQPRVKGEFIAQKSVPITSHEAIMREGEKFHKYEVDLPIDAKWNLGMDAVTLTIWSETPLPIDGANLDQLKALIRYNKDDEHANLPVLIGNGYLAKSEQYNWHDQSMIEAINHSIRRKSKIKDKINPIYIGFSGPGFEGSELKDEPNAQSVGIEKNEQLIEAIILGLDLRHAALVGHSAAGAAVLQFVHELNELNMGTPERIKEKLDLAQRTIIPIAITPAINLNDAWQFKFMEILNKAKSLLLNIQLPGHHKEWRDELTEKVVQYALGLPMTAKLDELPRPEQAEVALHIDLLNRNIHAAYAKLHDLFVPTVNGKKTTIKTTIIAAENDRITPVKQLIEGLGLTAKTASSFIDIIPGMHHDDMFMKQEFQEEVAERITTALFLSPLRLQKDPGATYFNLKRPPNS